MKIIERKTVIQEELPTLCQKCGSKKILISRIPGTIPLAKMKKKKFLYGRIIRCTNKECNAVWNDYSSIINEKNYDYWLKPPTKSLFEIS